MPAMMIHSRHDQPIPYRWGWWHVQMMQFVSLLEGGNLISTGSHVVQQEYIATDPADGEVMIFLPGDRLEAYRAPSMGRA